MTALRMKESLVPIAGNGGNSAEAVIARIYLEGKADVHAGHSDRGKCCFSPDSTPVAVIVRLMQF